MIIIIIIIIKKIIILIIIIIININIMSMFFEQFIYSEKLPSSQVGLEPTTSVIAGETI